MNALQLINSFIALKKFNMLIKEREQQKEAQEKGSAEVAKHMRKLEQQSARRSSGTSGSYTNPQAVAQAKYRRALKEKERRRRYEGGRGTGMPSTSARVERSAMDKLFYMRKAEEIQNKFPREVLAAQQEARQQELDYADRVRRYAAQDAMTRSARGWGQPLPEQRDYVPPEITGALPEIYSSTDTPELLPLLPPSDDILSYSDMLEALTMLGENK